MTAGIQVSGKILNFSQNPVCSSGNTGFPTESFGNDKYGRVVIPAGNTRQAGAAGLVGIQKTGKMVSLSLY